MSLHNDEFTKCIKTIYTQIKTRSYSILSSIKPAIGIYPENMRLSITNDIAAYNKDKKQIELGDIIAQTECKFIIHAALFGNVKKKNMWYKMEYYSNKIVFSSNSSRI